MKLVLALACTLAVAYGCKTQAEIGNNKIDRSWTNCNPRYTSPEYSYKVYENNSQNGFWITVVDSSDKTPLINTSIEYGSDSKKFKTNDYGSAWINDTSMDTAFITFIGFEKQYFYRQDNAIDSVVIFMRPCTTHIHHNW